MPDRVGNRRPPSASSAKGSKNHVLPFMEDSRRTLHSKDRIDDCMNTRRFAVLHHRSLREQQQEIHLQKETWKLPIYGNGGDHHLPACTPQRAGSERKKWLPIQLGGVLRPFSEFNPIRKKVGSTILNRAHQILPF